MFAEAWDLVKPETIANCSKKAFRLNENQPEIDPLWDIPTNLEIDREAFDNEFISKNQQIEEEFEDYLDEVVIDFKEPPTILENSTVPEIEKKISTVEAMKHLTELKNYLQSLLNRDSGV